MGKYFTDGSHCLAEHCVVVASAIINSMDKTVNPCDDFYEYACGGWLKQNPIPNGKSIWGTFDKLEQKNQLVVKNVLGKKILFIGIRGETKTIELFHRIRMIFFHRETVYRYKIEGRKKGKALLYVLHGCE